MNNSTEWSKFEIEPPPDGAGLFRLILMKAPESGRRRIKLLLHILAWVTLLGLPLYFIKRWHVDEDFIWLYYINITLNGIIFYSNYLILIPKYFFSSKRYRYYISVIILLGSFYVVSDISNKTVFRYYPSRYQAEVLLQKAEASQQHMPPPDLGIKRPPFRQMHLFNYTFNAVFLIFFSLGLKVLERQNKYEEDRKELEKEKLNSELAFLKNQVSPHFFFNTLNNIYSLIGISPSDSQDAVLKLSKMMRYLLYESESGSSELCREIEFLNNYIDLMKLRLSEKVSLTISFPEKCSDIYVPPLLFIPFIENAFKHGVRYRGNSFIDISLKAENNIILFNCSNSIGQPPDENKSDSSGIGLENVRKRLNLLFPGRHQLDITRDEDRFDVILKIFLAK